MAKWHPIKTVPVNKNVDVWAIQTGPDLAGILRGRRWPDVQLVRRKAGTKDEIMEYWQGLPAEWVPTHWRDVPRQPK